MTICYSDIQIFACGRLSGASWVTINRVFLSNVDPGVLRQYCTEFFPMQCCLKFQRQQCIGFWPVQYSLKNIKTTLKRIFSCALLSRASRTTLHWVFPVQYCSRSIETTLHKIFYCAKMSGAPPTALYKVLTFISIMTEFFLVQCCLEPLGQHCTGF